MRRSCLYERLWQQGGQALQILISIDQVSRAVLSTQANSLQPLVEYRLPSYLKFLRHLLSVSMNI
jgi:hypothetical protein